MLKENVDDFWIIGLNTLNDYTSDFDLDTMAFSIVDYNGNKSYGSTESALYTVDVENTTPWGQVAF